MAKLRDTSRPSDSTNDMKQSSWSTLTTPCRKELITRREREGGGLFRPSYQLYLNKNFFNRFRQLSFILFY